MDPKHLWIRNRHLLDVMTDGDLHSKHKEILHLFESRQNDIRGIVKALLRREDNVTYTTQTRLFRILKEPSSKAIQRDDALPSKREEAEAPEERVSLSDMNEGCLTHLLKFCSIQDGDFWALSMTSRGLYLASGLKNSWLNADINPPYPQAALCNFIAKLVAVDNETDQSLRVSTFIDISNRMFSWVKEHDKCWLPVLAYSELPARFCNGLHDAKLVGEHPTFIDNVLMFLMNVADEKPFLLLNADVFQAFSTFLLRTKDEQIVTRALPRIVHIMRVVHEERLQYSSMEQSKQNKNHLSHCTSHCETAICEPETSGLGRGRIGSIWSTTH